MSDEQGLQLVASFLQGYRKGITEMQGRFGESEYSKGQLHTATLLAEVLENVLFSKRNVEQEKQNGE